MSIRYCTIHVRRLYNKYFIICGKKQETRFQCFARHIYSPALVGSNYNKHKKTLTGFTNADVYKVTSRKFSR